MRSDQPRIINSGRMPRRRFLSLTAACAAGVYGLSVTPFSAWSRPIFVHAAVPSSLDKAYLFLDRMMDLYFQGSTLRLIESYHPTHALNLGDTGFTYDNAATLIALLQRGTADDLSRANVLGDSLVYAQTNDPIGDGRIRDAFHVDPFILPGGAVNISSGGTQTGNMGWTGLALAHLYARTNTQSFLMAALGIGNWIQANTYDTRGAGGYTGGVMADQQPELYKSTENNIDVYAFFNMLAAFTGDPAWTTNAQYALGFITAMWDMSGGWFWTGTTVDGVTINTYPIPEDVQAWSYLALQNPSYASSLDWAYTNLAATNHGFSGVSFSNADLSGVWFEGTAHMAAAFEARNASGDAAKAAAYLENIQLAQKHALNANGHGIVAASKNGLKTGFGDDYFAALHIGATSWYCFAAQSANPFVL
jgi:hypothetical protein